MSVFNNNQSIYNVVNGPKQKVSCIYNVVNGPNRKNSCIYNVVNGLKFRFWSIYNVVNGPNQKDSCIYNVVNALIIIENGEWQMILALLFLRNTQSHLSLTMK